MAFRTGATLLLLLPLAFCCTGVSAQDLELGEAMYDQQCLACHGELEHPGGPVEDEPGVIPAYYVGNRYLTRVPPMNLQAAILFGVPGTGMTGIGGIPNEQLDSLIAYIESFRHDD